MWNIYFSMEHICNSDFVRILFFFPCIFFQIWQFSPRNSDGEKNLTCRILKLWGLHFKTILKNWLRTQNIIFLRIMKNYFNFKRVWKENLTAFSFLNVFCVRRDWLPPNSENKLQYNKMWNESWMAICGGKNQGKIFPKVRKCGEKGKTICSSW